MSSLVLLGYIVNEMVPKNFTLKQSEEGLFAGSQVTRTYFLILSTAGSFKKIPGKGGVEYLILNFYLPRGHVQSNVQSTEGIISFRIYNIYFHHNVRSHGAGVTPQRTMH